MSRRKSASPSTKRCVAAPITYKDKQTEITGMDNNPHLITWVYIRLISKILLPSGVIAAIITLYQILSG